MVQENKIISLQSQGNQVMIDGIAYKIGLRGFVFVKTSRGWMRSSKEPRDLQRALDEQNTIEKTR